MSKKLLLSIFSFLFFACFAAKADTVVASGAGPLPGSAQDLTGIANVTEITGSIPIGTDANGFPDPNGVDVFAIKITDFASFSATTIATSFGIPDTELFLFDSAGVGVYANDDISGDNTLSSLPTGLGPTSNGVYYLAITRSFNSPLDGDGNYIFNFGSSTDILSVASSEAVAGWDGTANASPDFDLTNFDIVLTGTSPVPEPATLTLLGAGAAFALIRRKRLATR